jgi:hypothetical protein
MSPAHGAAGTVMVNRAPVLALWAAVVAERKGYRRDEALTLGQSLSGLNARRKGRGLGIYHDKGKPQKHLPVHEGTAAKARASKTGATFAVPLLGREIPAIATEDGVRALSGGKATNPDTAARYVASKFGDDLARVRAAMERLAESLSPAELEERGFELYEAFRPKIPPGTRGWGAKGALDLGVIRELASKAR